MQNILQVKITYDETLTAREHHVFLNDTNIFVADAKTFTAELRDTEQNVLCSPKSKCNLSLMVHFHKFMT